MDIFEIMEARHSVRQYSDEPISADVLNALKAEIDAANEESGLHIQLVTDEKKAFDSMMAHYGKFSGVHNYIALIGSKGALLEEKCGYYGERIVLKAQELGLNTCWVALTFGKGAAKKKCCILPGEKLCCVIAVGHGKTQGTAHKSKTYDDVADSAADAPEWFKKGVKAALLAPTAVNQQKFMLTLSGSTVTAKNLGGFYSGIDLGIVKCHFELGAGKENFNWA